MDRLKETDIKYLMNNKDFKGKIEQLEGNNVNKRDIKFYKKRIYDLTKQLLNGNDIINITGDVQLSFGNYIKTTIDYFKSLDKNDILQDTYNDIEINDIEDMDISYDDANKELFMRSIKISKPHTLLDNFVKIKNTKPKKTYILPLRKKINLKDPVLKNKGIRKKKNINNKYDEKQDEEI
jgi:hypothetical protein